MYNELQLNRIKWQCRRGMKELDLFVETFFEKEFMNLNENDQKVFVSLLEETDLNLFRWLLRGETPTNPDFQRMISLMIESYNSNQ